MNSITFDISPHTFNALALVIVGLSGCFYLLRLEEKPATLRFYILSLACFTGGAITMLFNSMVLWGGALIPFSSACLAAGVAVMIKFISRYPRQAVPSEMRLIRILAAGISLAAVFYSLYYAGFVLVGHTYNLSIPSAFYFLNPSAFLLGLIAVVRRIVLINTERPAGWRAFFKPQNRPVRVLRNLSLALLPGLLYGLIFIPEAGALFSPSDGSILTFLLLLFMIAAVIYASFEIAPQQPSLMVRLVGLSLVTLLSALVSIGVYDVDLSIKWTLERNTLIVNDVRNAIRFKQLDNMPDELVYVIARRPNKSGGIDGQVVYTAKNSANMENLLKESPGDALAPVWVYYIERNLQAAPERPVLRYGEHVPGSYHRYVSYLFKVDEVEYEAGFSLAEMSGIVQTQSSGMTWGILGSSIFILFVFPQFFRSNLIRPLERLIKGVRLADAGKRNIHVVVSHNDEIGYLTISFNKMIASINQELEGKQKAEAELRRLNLSLEERVAGRTQKLEALYNVTAANIQAGDSQTLFDILLKRCLYAMRAASGFILLSEGQDSQPFKLAAAQALPPDWLTHLESPHLMDDWTAHISSQNEPLFITDTRSDERTPTFMSAEESLTVVLAPLKTEGHCFGIMGMARPKAEAFTLDESALLISILNQVAVIVYTDHLRRLVQQANMIEERQRLARDLHDSVTQSLYGLVTFTEVGLMHLENGNLSQLDNIYQKIEQGARQAIREMHLFIHQLYLPELEQAGLINALNLRLAAVEGRTDIKAQLLADEDIRLPLPVEIAFYHIAQEALNNSLKHARASLVTVSLQRLMQSVIMEITDDGQGFDLQNNQYGGMGLGNMQARACEIGAQFKITSHPGSGTRVTVSLEV